MYCDTCKNWSDNYSWGSRGQKTDTPDVAWSHCRQYGNSTGMYYSCDGYDMFEPERPADHEFDDSGPVTIVRK